MTAIPDGTTGKPRTKGFQPGTLITLMVGSAISSGFIAVPKNTSDPAAEFFIVKFVRPSKFGTTLPRRSVVKPPSRKTVLGVVENRNGRTLTVMFWTPMVVVKRSVLKSNVALMLLPCISRNSI